MSDAALPLTEEETEERSNCCHTALRVAAGHRYRRRKQDMMRLHNGRLAKVASLQPVTWRRTLKLTDCHTSNEARSEEVSGVLS